MHWKKLGNTSDIPHWRLTAYTGLEKALRSPAVKKTCSILFNSAILRLISPQTSFFHVS